MLRCYCNVLSVMTFLVSHRKCLCECDVMFQSCQEFLTFSNTNIDKFLKETNLFSRKMNSSCYRNN